MTQIAYALHLCTTNDVSGNPRRVFVGFDAQGHVVVTSDEGYEGAPRWLRDLRSRGIFETVLRVHPSEYKRYRNHALAEALV